MTSPASRSQTPLSAGWQDISSAPTMEAVLVYGGEVKYPVVASWTGLNDEPWTLDALGNVHDEIDWPTHWMPLPEPPAEEDLSGAQRSELTRLAQDEPISSPPSTGGEGEAVAWRIPNWRIDGEQYDYTHDPAVVGALRANGRGNEIAPLYLHPSPEMGEISREELEASLNKALRLQVDTLIGEICALVPQNYDGWDYHGRHWTDRIAKRATDEILKLKENGLSREELGGSAQSQPGAAGPSDCAEGDVRLSDGREAYRGWWISYDPPPIPTRNCDWQFWHDDFDGAPDAGDSRSGHAESLEAAKAEIDFWIEENFDCRCSASDPGDCMAIECEWRKPGAAR